MSRGVQRCKTDANHQEVMKALNACGMRAVSCAALGNGFPDISVGFRGLNVFLEIKDGSKVPSARKMTSDEMQFHLTWPGQVAVATSPEEACEIVIAYAKKMGVI